MEEMNALERQLTGVVQGAMRPPRPVDAAPPATSAKERPSGGSASTAP